MPQIWKYTYICDWDRKVIAPLYMALVATALFPLGAQADADVPTLVYLWPASWYLFFIIVPIEAIIAKSILQVNYQRCFLLSLTANAVSTVTGIPLAWGIIGGAMFVNTALANNLPSLGHTWFITAWGKLLDNAVIVPTLYLDLRSFNDQAKKTVAAILLVMFPTAFLISVWSEYFVARFFVHDKTKALRWPLIANAASYGLIIILIGILACFYIRH